MAEWIVETIESQVVVRKVFVPDGYHGDHEREAKHIAFRGEGEVLEGHPAAGDVVQLNWDTWDAVQVEDEEHL